MLIRFVKLIVIIKLKLCSLTHRLANQGIGTVRQKWNLYSELRIFVHGKQSNFSPLFFQTDYIFIGFLKFLNVYQLADILAFSSFQPLGKIRKMNVHGTFSPNVRKYGPKILRIRTLFTQSWTSSKLLMYVQFTSCTQEVIFGKIIELLTRKVL